MIFLERVVAVCGGKKDDMRKKGSLALLLFLLGLGEQTQVRLVGYIGISEFFIFLLAPFIFIQDAQILKRDGFLRLAQLALLA